MAKQPQMHDEPNSGIDKKKVVQKTVFFFAKPLSFDFNFESAASEYMPHCSFTSNFSHEYHLLFLNFRLIGLKVKFDDEKKRYVNIFRDTLKD